jgi:hypothetical protein
LGKLESRETRWSVGAYLRKLILRCGETWFTNEFTVRQKYIKTGPSTNDFPLAHYPKQDRVDGEEMDATG